MPATERGFIVEEENMVSWSGSDPTMTADLEGWRNYRSDLNRWYSWDGTAWRKELWDLDLSLTSAASKVPLADGSGNIDPDWIAAGAIANAKLANMAAGTVKGRPIGAGTGVPTDIAQGTGGGLDADKLDGNEATAFVLQTETATSPGASKVVRADGSGNIDDDWLATAGVAVGKLVSASGDAILRGHHTTGVAEWQTVGANEVVARGASTGGVQGITIPTQSILLRQAGDLTTDTAAASTWLGRGAAGGDVGFKTALALLKDVVSNAPMVGTSFPASPVDGQPFYHTTHETSYHFSSTASAWLSDQIHEIMFGDTASVASGTYFRQFPLSAAQRYSSTVGERYGFDVVIVGISVTVAASSTCTITVEDDDSDVTNGALSLSSETNKADEAMLSSVIGSGSIVGVKCTSGTATTGCSGRIRFRRRET